MRKTASILIIITLCLSLFACTAENPPQAGGYSFTVEMENGGVAKESRAQMQGFFDVFTSGEPCELTLTGDGSRTFTVAEDGSVVETVDGEYRDTYSHCKFLLARERGEYRFFTYDPLSDDSAFIIRKDDPSVDLGDLGFIVCRENNEYVFDSANAEPIVTKDGFAVSGEQTLSYFVRHCMEDRGVAEMTVDGVTYTARRNNVADVSEAQGDYTREIGGIHLRFLKNGYLEVLIEKDFVGRTIMELTPQQVLAIGLPFAANDRNSFNYIQYADAEHRTLGKALQLEYEAAVDAEKFEFTDEKPEGDVRLVIRGGCANAKLYRGDRHGFSNLIQLDIGSGESLYVKVSDGFLEKMNGFVYDLYGVTDDEVAGQTDADAEKAAAMARDWKFYALPDITEGVPADSGDFDDYCYYVHAFDNYAEETQDGKRFNFLAHDFLGYPDTVPEDFVLPPVTKRKKELVYTLESYERDISGRTRVTLLGSESDGAPPTERLTVVYTSYYRYFPERMLAVNRETLAS